VPVPGATRLDSARTIARYRGIALTDGDRALLDERAPAARTLRLRLAGSLERKTASASRDGEVVLIMGLPGAGKSTLAGTYVARGYERLNRDETSGSLRALSADLDRLLAGGAARVVLDNTYVSRASRADVVAAASAHQLPVRCVWLQTSVEEAQVNAVNRLLTRYGRLLTPAELKQAKRRDTAAFGPMVQFRYQRELEPPEVSEGFASIEVRQFEREPERSHSNRAVVIWCDGLLIRSRSGRRVPMSPDDVELVPGTVDTLRRYHGEGWLVLGLSWQPEIAEQELTEADVASIFQKARDLLGVPMTVVHCPHPAGPPICWCRKPLPGLGLEVIQRYHLDPSQSIYVGAGAQDPGFARRLGFQFRTASDFFAES
jgi:histidinol phosphatase-like enzyme